MKQKTAMMELKDKIQASIGTMDGELNDYNSGWKQCLLDIQYQIDSQVLEKEKEQIMNAFLMGTYIYTEYESADVDDINSANDYYNQTYLEETKEDSTDEIDPFDQRTGMTDWRETQS